MFERILICSLYTPCCIYSNMAVGMDLCISMYVYVCIYIHAHIYTCLYTHMYICRDRMIGHRPLQVDKASSPRLAPLGAATQASASRVCRTSAGACSTEWLKIGGPTDKLKIRGSL